MPLTEEEEKEIWRDNMIQNNSYEVEYMYDKTSDILGIKVTRDFIYSETIELDEGLLLDFDENNIPTALEIHDASKRLNVPKNSLNELLFFHMKVIVDAKSININAIFGILVHEKENQQELESFTSNTDNMICAIIYALVENCLCSENHRDSSLRYVVDEQRSAISINCSEQYALALW